MLLRLLFRATLVIAASVFIASLLVAGAVLALGYMLWCLLHGRKPHWPTVFMGPLQHLRRRPHQNRQPPHDRARAQAGRPSWGADMAHGFRPSGHPAGVVEGQAREIR
jgi:hypothetical protein